MCAWVVVFLACVSLCFSSCLPTGICWHNASQNPWMLNVVQLFPHSLQKETINFWPGAHGFQMCFHVFDVLSNVEAAKSWLALCVFSPFGLALPVFAALAAAGGCGVRFQLQCKAFKRLAIHNLSCQIVCWIRVAGMDQYQKIEKARHFFHEKPMCSLSIFESAAWRTWTAWASPNTNTVHIHWFRWPSALEQTCFTWCATQGGRGHLRSRLQGPGRI